jgi:nitroreductase
MNQEQISSLIKERRSTYPKQFSSEKIDKENVEKWLEMANWAPNHKLTEPWRFVVFSEKSLSDLVDSHKELYLSKTPPEAINEAKLAKFDVVQEKTSHILAIVCQLDQAKRLPEWEEIAATAMAVQNLYLAMDAFDICGYWSTGNGTNSPKMRELLTLSESQVHLGWLYLGKPDPTLPQGRRIRRPMESKIEWR